MGIPCHFTLLSSLPLDLRFISVLFGSWLKAPQYLTDERTSRSWLHQTDTLARVSRSERNTNPSSPTAPTMRPRYPNPLCAMCAKLLQLCLTLCDPTHCSLPGSSVHGILQARILVSAAFPPPGDLSDPGVQPMSLMSPALAGRFFTTSATQEGHANPLLQPI